MSVAAVITCFNEAAFVEEALESVLAQTAAEAIQEIVLVDDGSDAPTQAVLDTLKGRDRRLRLLRSPGGWGIARARNQAVAATSAPLIAFLDADDAWALSKLERQIAALDAAPEVDLVYTGYEALAPGASSGTSVRVHDLSAHPDPVRRYFLHDTSIMPSSMMVRRAAFEAAGGFDETVRIFEDTDFCLRAAHHGTLKGLPEPLIRKRFRADSLSAARPELMAHHAYVAFAAAARDPQLAPFVNRRLAERAARLGLLAYAGGDLEAARPYAEMARRLALFQPRSLLLNLLLTGGGPLHRVLETRLRSRRRLHGG